MKYTSTLIFLLTVGLVSAEETKKTGTYPEWKAAAEHADKVTKSKHELIQTKANALEGKAKEEVNAEVVNVKAKLEKVTAEVKTIVDLEEAEFKKAKDDKEKEAVAVKAATAGSRLVTTLLDFETLYKKTSFTHSTKLAEKEGTIKVLEFLKGKIASLEADSFLATSVGAAIALSALAIGSTYN
ncbi:conserved hypothetical protein [Theileria orientalis strain Shintoku]|uniref:Uncharacterized protein n=1 Tax=Theileria orientalis strain Shintoku TaxID=869250 RepID=J4CDN5_THEOR|nr:conserved hypothetical protein [Theileria orientalis strain Shintoku]PVC53755.1 hypothetical protein MACL_00003505 [Theileria orientalis]BAM41452.1 conserved hypothetical protein [Theileria orientalis strain Shintoku]|eukprot:XP_009691753.1 conserved hypothetical protein [Theileria orientalis strain Shintoku]